MGRKQPNPPPPDGVTRPPPPPAPPAINHRLEKVAAEPVLDKDKLTQITMLAQQALALEKTIAAQQEETKRTVDRYNSIVQDKLPGILLAAGVKRLTLDTGHDLLTEDWVTANITEENRTAAHQWLRDNGFGSLIKTAITVSFGMGEEAKAEKLYLQVAKKYEDVKKEDRVHSSTLRSFCRERLAKGEELPVSINVHSIPITTVKPIKEKHK